MEKGNSKRAHENNPLEENVVPNKQSRTETDRYSYVIDSLSPVIRFIICFV